MISIDPDRVVLDVAMSSGDRLGVKRQRLRTGPQALPKFQPRRTSPVGAILCSAKRHRSGARPRAVLPFQGRSIGKEEAMPGLAPEKVDA
jgi:hypothetical protein